MHQVEEKPYWRMCLQGSQSGFRNSAPINAAPLWIRSYPICLIDSKSVYFAVFSTVCCKTKARRSNFNLDLCLMQWGQLAKRNPALGQTAFSYKDIRVWEKKKKSSPTTLQTQLTSTAFPGRSGRVFSCHQRWFTLIAPKIVKQVTWQLAPINLK